MSQILFKDITIIDGHGKEPFHGDVLVEGERIKDIGKELKYLCHTKDNHDVKIINGRGKYLIPGIINTHVHVNADAYLEDSLFRAAHESDTLTAFRGQKNLMRMLTSGITYARDLGGKGFTNIELRKARQMALTEGAEFITAGECITTTGGHCWLMSRECDGESEVKKAVREQLKAGADCIKILITGGHGTKGVHPKAMQFTFEEVRAAVEIAHFANKKVAAHTNGLEAIRMAVMAGVDSIEHCEFFPEDDADGVMQVIQMMVEKGVYYVPTYSTWFKNYPLNFGYLGAIDPVELAKDELRQPDHIRPMGMKREYFSMKQIMDNGLRMHQAGVKIAMGTDSGVINVHFDKYPFEMKLMKEMGMTALEVISSSTIHAAQLLGIDAEYGSIDVGKYADLVFVNEDPLVSFDALYAIESVIKKGIIVT